MLPGVHSIIAPLSITAPASGTPIVCTGLAGKESKHQAPVPILREAVTSLLPLALQMSMAPDAASRAASSKALLPALLSAVHSASATAGKQS